MLHIIFSPISKSGKRNLFMTTAIIGYDTKTIYLVASRFHPYSRRIYAGYTALSWTVIGKQRSCQDACYRVLVAPFFGTQENQI